MRCFSSAHWPTRPSPSAEPLGLVRAAGVAGQQPRARAARRDVLHLVERALLRVDERRQLGQQHAADRHQVALALQHARELGQVRLQPVLFLVALRGAHGGCRSSC